MNVQHRAFWILVALLLSAYPLAVSSQAQEAKAQYIVQYLPGADVSNPMKVSQRRQRIKSLGGSIRLEIPSRRAFSAMLDQNAVAVLRASPDVGLVELDPPRHLMAESLPSGISAIKADQVSYAGDPGIKICVIDSGYDLGHPDLPSGARVDGSSSVLGPWNQDASGHGTHVSGIIMAMQNSQGVRGVVADGNFAVHVHRVFNDEGESSSSSEVVLGLERCIAEGAKVVNLSLGCSGTGCYSSFEKQAFADAFAAGVLSIAAAGNDGDGNRSYPAAYDSVIAVAAVDANSIVASFSQHYSEVELSAPGVAVRSTVPRSTGFGGTLTVASMDLAASALTGSANGDFTGALVDCGLGDSTCVGVEDAVCFIQRGTFLFAEKAESCELGGGKAVVIYNNVAGPFLGTLGDYVTQLPVIGISDTDGALLQGFLGSQAQVFVGATDYDFKNGTSMATPHVTGAAALLWGYNPNWSNLQIRNALIAGALDLGIAGRDESYGYGLIDVLASLNSLFGDGDSDADGMPDNYELANALNAFNPADAAQDADLDGLTNLLEYQQGTDPNDSNSPVLLDPTELPFEKKIFFANPASNVTQQTFIRFVNTSGTLNSVEVRGIDDAGQAAPLGVLRFDIPALGSLQLNAQDLEFGNSGKGISGQLGNGTGKWQLSVGSSAMLETLSLIRTPDGFLTSLTDSIGLDGGVYSLNFANPASNPNQQSFLRVINTSSASGEVTVTGIDDNGNAAPGGALTFTLSANAAKNFNSTDYELGNVAKGIAGALGDGSGKWRLTVSSALSLEVMSLIRTPDGFLTNLSASVDEDAEGVHNILFANPAQTVAQQSFLRFINASETAGSVSISARDDAGNSAPGGEVIFTLGARQALQLNANDLENGNSLKGLQSGFGSGEGRWQLSVVSDLDLRVMNMIRTPDGFVTNMSQAVAGATITLREVSIFNPASNINQRSFLRVINRSESDASVEINAIDDAGVSGAGGSVNFSVVAGGAVEFSAVDLELGADTLTGAIGNGTGKWRLSISADVEIEVQSLLNTPTGFLTNLSSATK